MSAGAVNKPYAIEAISPNPNPKSEGKGANKVLPYLQIFGDARRYLKMIGKIFNVLRVV